ncbi:hypothetical protein P3X46_004811 [Hevea brasiliensis]|uniref:HAT C-terminal dimerisation domain-containing protein n=1 Tax=Hevea brasiliensis TaxID=3981 RepID=A0ABQ9N0H4_HEVBR|nr:hypothetical protein P3X46_004811 [Hevea brasiliensis]
MAIIIRYVEKNGHVLEHILGILHVTDTSALSLKAAIDALFSKHSLSISRLWAKAMMGQATCEVTVTKTDVSIALLFTLVSNVVNVVGGSCKLHDIFQESQAIRILEALENESTLKRARDTRWASHYKTLISLIKMFSVVIDALEWIMENPKFEQKAEAFNLLDSLQSFDSNAEFLNLIGISNLAEKVVKTKRNMLYSLVYRLITLALILPVATAFVKRAFSAMKIVKNRLRNRMGDQWMSDCLITYIEKEIFNSIDNKVIMQSYQNMKTRREQLSLRNPCIDVMRS